MCVSGLRADCASLHLTSRRQNLVQNSMAHLF
uniref:Uncharacterized protein n=1 Tax=Rhizophora mucronata TaxID=61149 RepID=A0A2P2IH92_RHIMU